MNIPLLSETGITVKQLREWLAQVPDTNDQGEPSEVWITNTDNECFSNPCHEVFRLNKTDIVLGIGESVVSPKIDPLKPLTEKQIEHLRATSTYFINGEVYRVSEK